MNNRQLLLILRKGPKVLPKDLDLLIQDTKLNPVDKGILVKLEGKVRKVIRDRLIAYPSIYRESKKIMSSLWLIKIPTRFLWSYVLPLAQFLLSNYQKRNKPLIVGVTGRGTGAGKTTLVNLLKIAIEQLSILQGRSLKAISVSMDDFYITKQQRIERGFKWRGLPGTHDINLGIQVLTSLKESKSNISLPRFDLSLDDRVEFEKINHKIDICFIDSVSKGNHCPGQEKLNQLINFLIFLDMSMDALKRNRLIRELRVNRLTGKGFDRKTMLKFWEEVAQPMSKEYFFPMEGKADLVIKLSEKHQPLNIEFRR